MNIKIKNWIDKNIDVSLFKNKNVFITGGNSGIGFELAKECAYLGSNLFLLCRNQTKAEEAKATILKEYPNTNIVLINLDLASFSNIELASNELKKYNIDIFVNNAGVYHLPKCQTKDGYEIIMGTNFLGTLYLNDLLMNQIKNNNQITKVCFVTSITSKCCSIDYSDLFMDKHYKQMKIYGRSKVAINNIFYNYIDEYSSKTNIVYSLTHPGGTYTPLIAKGYKNKVFQFFASLFMRLVFHSPSKASLSILYSLSKNENNCAGPRGLFEMSGYPHMSLFKRDPKYKDCVTIGRHLIKDKLLK